MFSAFCKMSFHRSNLQKNRINYREVQYSDQGRKLNGAHEECRRQGIAFLPIVAETFGGWHPEAGREVKKLGAALARLTGQEEGEAVSHLWSRMGILLQRGNAAILEHRIPALPGAHFDGII